MTTELNTEIPTAEAAIKLTEAAIDHLSVVIDNRIAEAITEAAKSGVCTTSVEIPGVILEYALERLKALGYTFRETAHGRSPCHTLYVHAIKIDW